MAVADDLKKLAALDVCYLSAAWVNTNVVIFLQGRLRQSIGSEWIFTTSLGQSGVVGFDLGIQTEQWTSSESPATGLKVNVIQAASVPGGQIQIVLTLSSVLSPVFSE
jgi:hypothetical protein